MNKPVSPSKWYYGIGPILGALFLLGPLAFPLLWKSPRFNLFWKIFLTAGCTAATIYMLITSWQLVIFLMGEIKRLSNAMQS